MKSVRVLPGIGLLSGSMSVGASTIGCHCYRLMLNTYWWGSFHSAWQHLWMGWHCSSPSVVFSPLARRMVSFCSWWLLLADWGRLLPGIRKLASMFVEEAVQEEKQSIIHVSVGNAPSEWTVVCVRELQCCSLFPALRRCTCLPFNSWIN